MSRQTAALDVWCDAPCYTIVQACQWLGFERPLDVAWYHRGRYLSAHRPAPSILGIFSLARLFGRSELATAKCRCGLALPALERCLFTMNAVKDDAIRLGQCSRCYTIFWDEC